MSGSGNQPNQGGDQPQQGGQAQGGQPQGNQAQGGQPHQGGQPQQGDYGQPPQGGGESPVDALQRPGPQRYLKGIGILSGIAGVAFSVMMILVMKIGGFPVLPAAVQQARNLAAAAGGATTGGATAASPTQQLDAGISTSHQVIISYMSTELAPFIAFGLALVVGVIVATQMSDDGQAKLATAGAGMFVGGLLIVVISSALIGFLGPSVPQSLLSSAGAGGVAGAVNPSLATPQWGNIIINGILAGVGAGAGAAATVFSLDNYLLE